MPKRRRKRKIEVDDGLRQILLKEFTKPAQKIVLKESKPVPKIKLVERKDED